MATRDPRSDFLLGLLIGAGVGLATAWLLDPKRGRKNRERLLGHARRVADRAPRIWRERKIKRAGRTMDKRIDRIRSAGF
jgi:gas vesicle protein